MVVVREAFTAEGATPLCMNFLGIIPVPGKYGMVMKKQLVRRGLRCLTRDMLDLKFITANIVMGSISAIREVLLSSSFL